MDSTPTPTSSSQPRTSSGSTRPHGSRSTNPDKQISQIEKSVTHLLVATKQLLETLTQWSRGNAQEEEVSDVYVRLGYEFNLACRAFNSIGVETSDLGPVPDLLRSILEDTLSQPASPQSLDNYLPRIRDIIINLLHGLKRKQSKLRNRPAKDGPSKVAPAPGRQASVASVASAATGDTGSVEDNSKPTPSVRSQSRQDNGRSDDELTRTLTTTSQPSFNRGSLHRQSIKSPIRQTTPSDIAGTSAAPYSVATAPEPERTTTADSFFPHPPPPPPKQDALTALQRGGDLERRASRRFSAYQIQKHLGASPNGIPVIPPAQNSPIPNRGREVKESMSAVRSRTSYQSTRQRPANRLADLNNGGSVSTRTAPPRISEEREMPLEDLANNPPVIDLPAIPDEVNYSPTVKTPEEFKGSIASPATSTDTPVVGAIVNGPLSATPAEVTAQLTSSEEQERTLTPEVIKVDTSSQTLKARNAAVVTPMQHGQLSETSEPSPPQSKALTLFLQYKSKIKKFVLTEGYEELTIARLQLAFIEKFNWNTHNNGVDLPEIYVQDPVSGVRHELEDLSDVKDRSVLVLNIEVLDEVKKHFDEGLGGLRSTLEGVRALIDGQGSLMQRFSDRQLEASKEMARLSAAPPPRATRPTANTSSLSTTVTASEASMSEVQNLRRDIAVLRQTYSTMSSDFTAAMKDIRAKAETVKSSAEKAVAPSYEGDAGRSHVNQGKKSLNSESEALVNRVDDLSDAVEDLRKDVVTRGVRPLPRQLEDISREITATAKDLLKVKDFMKREKPVWTKIWEQELNLVCTERDDLTQQEDLMADLDGDLEDITDVFKLVEEAMKQQNLQNPGQNNLRSTSKAIDIDPSIDPRSAKDGMLDEVRALQPNHEGRLEAIERAEKARLKELESRKGGEFQREVEQFVEEGKLKKTGGMEEVERLRKIKDERARKENFDTQQRMNIERERKRAEKAAAKAAAASAPPAPPDDAQATSSRSISDAQTTEAVEDLALPDLPSVDVDIDQSGDTIQDTLEDTPESTIISPQIEEGVQAPAALHLHQSPPQTPTESAGSIGSDEKEEKVEAHKPDSVHDDSDKDKSTGAEPPASTKADRQSWWKPAIFSP